MPESMPDDKAQVSPEHSQDMGSACQYFLAERGPSSSGRRAPSPPEDSRVAPFRLHFLGDAQLHWAAVSSPQQRLPSSHTHWTDLRSAFPPRSSLETPTKPTHLMERIQRPSFSPSQNSGALPGPSRSPRLRGTPRPLPLFQNGLLTLEQSLQGGVRLSASGFLSVGNNNPVN